MTTKPQIGDKLIASLGGLNVRVRVLDVKDNSGKTELLVTPLLGSGETWIDKAIIIEDNLGQATVDALNSI